MSKAPVLDQPALKPLPKVDLTGRVVIVTGANTGLGFEACKHVAAMNPAKLIMASRDLVRGTEALKKLQEDTGFANAEVGQLDQASFKSIKAFVSKFLQENDRLDLVLENAAVAPEKYEVTGDNWEQSLQVNVVGPAYLTFLLLPIIHQTAAKYTTTVPRITVVSSGVHAQTSFDEEALSALDESLLKKMNDPEYSQRVFPATQGDTLRGSKTMMERRYPDVKLMNVFFARELQAHLSKSNIEVNSACPGFCISNLRRHVTGERAKAMDEMTHLAYTSEEGGRNLTYGLVYDGEGHDMKGTYMSCMQIKDTSEFSNSETGKKASKALWRDLVQILKEVDPNVKDIVNSLN